MEKKSQVKTENPVPLFGSVHLNSAHVKKKKKSTGSNAQNSSEMATVVKTTH